MFQTICHKCGRKWNSNKKKIIREIKKECPICKGEVVE